MLTGASSWGLPNGYRILESDDAMGLAGSSGALRKGGIGRPWESGTLVQERGDVVGGFFLACWAW
jgi:hypothetical protein